jgi:hypothetical protein
MSDKGTKREPVLCSIGKIQAIALGESSWWVGKTAREICEFQMFTKELTMPFDLLHKAVQEALGRPVYTHEFAYLADLQDEFLGKRPAPTIEQIMELIPAEKRMLVIDTAAEAAKEKAK